MYNGNDKVEEGYLRLMKSTVRSPLTRLSRFSCGASNSLCPICLMFKGKGMNKLFANQVIKEGEKANMQVLYPTQTKLESSLSKGKLGRNQICLKPCCEFVISPKYKTVNGDKELLIFTADSPKFREILTSRTVASPFLNFG